VAIVGIEGMTPEQINMEVRAGARFVVFQYCISVLVLSFKRGSTIHFIRAGESGFGKSAPYSLCSLLLGWWGIPWGPIWTISTIFRNSRGGIDVTSTVVRSLNAPA
jgi:hypothetical protein